MYFSHAQGELNQERTKVRLVQARLTSTEAAYHEALNAAQRRPPALAEGPWQEGVPYPDGAHSAGQQSASLPLPRVPRTLGLDAEPQVAPSSASLPLAPQAAGGDARAAGGGAHAMMESAAGKRVSTPAKDAQGRRAEEEPGLAVRQLALWA